jgi:hypothetical protein
MSSRIRLRGYVEIRRIDLVSIRQRPAAAFGSKTEVERRNRDFRYTPESGLNSDITTCLKSATSGLLHRSNAARLAYVVG